MVGFLGFLSYDQSLYIDVIRQRGDTKRDNGSNSPYSLRSHYLMYCRLVLVKDPAEAERIKGCMAIDFKWSDIALPKTADSLINMPLTSYIEQFVSCTAGYTLLIILFYDTVLV